MGRDDPPLAPAADRARLSRPAARQRATGSATREWRGVVPCMTVLLDAPLQRLADKQAGGWCDGKRQQRMGGPCHRPSRHLLLAADPFVQIVWSVDVCPRRPITFGPGQRCRLYASSLVWEGEGRGGQKGGREDRGEGASVVHAHQDGPPSDSQPIRTACLLLRGGTLRSRRGYPKALRREFAHVVLVSAAVAPTPPPCTDGTVCNTMSRNASLTVPVCTR